MTLNRRDAIKAQRTKKKRQQRLKTILWIGGFIILVVLLFASPTIINAVKPTGSFIRITPTVYPMENGKAIGNPNAKVTIEVFEDFQCPACQGYTESTEKQLFASEYVTKGEVYYVFRQFPFLDQNSMSKESHQAANASMCAMEQNQFWAYHDLLFTNQGAENGGNFSDKRLKAFAESLNLDMTKFNSCFDSNKYASEIEADYTKGVNYKVDSTPTVMVNGKNVAPSGAPTYDLLKAAIDAALAGGG